MNSLSKFITSIAALTSLFFAAAAVAEDAVGQYQLFSAITEIVGGGHTTQQHTVFRINTKTGTTWTYEIGQGKDGKISEFWSEIPENPKVEKP